MFIFSNFQFKSNCQILGHLKNQLFLLLHTPGTCKLRNGKKNEKKRKETERKKNTKKTRRKVTKRHEKKRNAKKTKTK